MWVRTFSNEQNKARKALSLSPIDLELFYNKRSLSKDLWSSFNPFRSFDEKAIISKSTEISFISFFDFSSSIRDWFFDNLSALLRITKREVFVFLLQLIRILSESFNGCLISIMTTKPRKDFREFKYSSIIKPHSVLVDLDTFA